MHAIPVLRFALQASLMEKIKHPTLITLSIIMMVVLIVVNV